jgi:hypothetical protein
MSLAVKHGLGEKEHVRNHAETMMLEKVCAVVLPSSTISHSGFAQDIYSASLLYLISICLAKLCTLILIAFVLQNRSHLIGVWTIMVLVSLWGISVFFGDAFQCSEPRPYDTLDGKCINNVCHRLTHHLYSCDLALLTVKHSSDSGMQ